MRNLSPLFSRNENGFLGNLNLSKDQKDKIKEAKNKIREYLRNGIKEKIKEEHNYSISPKFLSQGSSVYKTQNQPCLCPPQQIDHDLGCYLPLSFIEETKKPSIAANNFFTIVDELLAEIVIQEKWKEVVTSKVTCSRVVVDNEIHIDVPLYSIPDVEFEKMSERVAKFIIESACFSMDSISEEQWSVIKNQVVLAHREDGWVVSDPRKLNKYFKDVFEVKGEQLRRICRYLKGWRDFKWQNGGPSSIYLMILADSIFSSEIEKRDDIALLKLLKQFPDKLKNDVRNPTDNSEKIRINPEAKEELISFSIEFAEDLEKAIDIDVGSLNACKLVQKNLGRRFPLDNSLTFNEKSIRDSVLATAITIDKEGRRPEDRGRSA